MSPYTQGWTPGLPGTGKAVTAFALLTEKTGNNVDTSFEENPAPVASVLAAVVVGNASPLRLEP